MGAEHPHCWHSTGQVLTSLPPKFPQVCCHCDEKRILDTIVFVDTGHGPYLPGPRPQETR